MSINDYIFTFSLDAQLLQQLVRIGVREYDELAQLDIDANVIKSNKK